jgi:hypothetical protein
MGILPAMQPDSPIRVQTIAGLDAAIDAARVRADVLGIRVVVQYRDTDVIEFPRESEGYDSGVIAETSQNAVQHDSDVMVGRGRGGK